MNAMTSGEILWLGVAAPFAISAIVCLLAKRWAFGIGLLLPGLLLGWAWQYDRTHETTSQLNLLLFDHKLIKENQEHPEKSLYFIRASGLELGMWEGKVRAEDIHLTKQASIVLVKLGKRPLTGTYIKSVADQGSDRPPKQFKFVSPPKGTEFEWA